MLAKQVKKLMNECGKKREPFLFAVDFDLQEGVFIKNPLEQNDILFTTPLGSNKPEADKTVIVNKTLHSFPISFEEYKMRFDTVMKGLTSGQSHLINLTVKTPIEISVGLRDIFMSSNSPYTLLVPDKFVCFSPERFVKISNRIISTNPMKGTINAEIPNAEQKILENEKEIAEHASIVKLLSSELSLVANEVEVKRYRYIDRVKTINGDILQVSSEISGKLPVNYHSNLGDIIFNLLPAGSVSGAPKKSTLELIKISEPHNRGFYAGVFGYFDGNELDSGVLIRFITNENGKSYFYSGGGITSKSNAESEYNEVLEKIYLPFE
ncbi:MAG: aminodeoxychorismate synthase component I [Paludibacteraceae bacterium]